MNFNSQRNKSAHFATETISQIFEELNVNLDGKNKKEVEVARNKYGDNKIAEKKKDTFLYRLRRSFINPFSVVLFIIALISLLSDVLLQSDGNKNFTTIIIISVMIIMSGIIRFIQEMHSKRVTEKLTKITDTWIMVKRDGEFVEKESEELVVGDIVKLKAGDRVPADIRLIFCEDCFVSESVISGESGLYEKSSQTINGNLKTVADFKNMVFQGTTITCGKAEGIVVGVGKNTVYGGIVPYNKNKINAFNKGANSIALVLIKFMALLVPIVFISSGITKADWLSSFLFSLSVAIGLTPELLPMVITACLAKGSFNMAKKNTVVKNINAMQGFGSMDVLCVDKTGTLTEDTLKLEYYMDIIGNECSKTLDLAYLNSFFHSGVKNHLDSAVINVRELSEDKVHYDELIKKYVKQDEFPFDYTRKISSVLLKGEGQNIIISKGNIDDIVSRCKKVEYKGKFLKIGNEASENAHAVVDDMLSDGMKVQAIAYKPTDKSQFSDQDENDLILVGFIAFFDAPKQSAISAIEKLKELNVKIKVLTGDNLNVALSVCKRLNISTDFVLTGAEFDMLDDNEAQVIVERTSLFAQLSPKQKADIVEMLQSNGHSVGFLGDGMNDLPAVVNANVGISVDTSAPSLKEGADVILLKKDLNVLESGIKEGRKSFVNMTKYIKITASSNLGNILSIVIASIFLPFFPMTSLQILLLNLLYDIICLVLPWDNVDKELAEKPLEWSGKKLSRFMIYFGPVSSVFDIITFCFLYFMFCPWICGGAYNTLSFDARQNFVALFQTGWFIESMWTQILIIYLLRSKSMPFVKSKPSKYVVAVTLIGIIVATVFTMTPVGNVIGLITLPPIYYVFLLIAVTGYLLMVTLVKKIYIKKYKNLL